jgi:hypothetical protein
MAQDPSIEAKLQRMMDELQQNNPIPEAQLVAGLVQN